MKKTLAIILSIVCLIFAVGCSEKVTDTIQKRDGLVYLPNETKPFTGVYIPTYPNGQKELEGNFKNGKREGLATLWDENGQKQSDKWNELEGLKTTIRRQLERRERR